MDDSSYHTWLLGYPLCESYFLEKNGEIVAFANIIKNQYGSLPIIDFCFIFGENKMDLFYHLVDKFRSQNYFYINILDQRDHKSIIKAHPFTKQNKLCLYLYNFELLKKFTDDDFIFNPWF